MLETIETAKKLKELEIEQQKLSKEMDNFYSEEYMLKVNINELNNLITELTQQLKNTPISKIMKQFR